MKLEINSVTKKFGSLAAVDNITVTLTNGIYGLLGPNGAGKTTLINMLSTVSAPDEGEIVCDGVSIKKLGAAYRSRIGYVPQFPRFYKNFSTKEFLLYMASLKGIDKKRAKEISNELMEKYNLSHLGNKKVGALSGGMKQRLGIAQAMLNDPELLILDEPTAGLDPVERVRFRNSVSELAAERIVILSTHIVQDVEYIAEQVILMNNGKIISQASPEEITEELDKKVYIIGCNKDQLKDYIGKMSISNIQQHEQGYTLRIISNAQLPDLQAVKPNLEDVFLYHFGGETK